MILEDAARKIGRYNDLALHYDLVASQIYLRRSDGGADPFGESFLPYIIAGLICFDMERMMGRGLAEKYRPECRGFAWRLSRKLQVIRPLLGPLVNHDITEVDLQQQRGAICEAYETLSDGGKGALHEQRKSFHVGATKILHFLNPKLFTIVDSNAARAFRHAPHNVPFRAATQPGYSADLYMRCMSCAQGDIRTYGLDRFQALEPGVPIMGLYDKLTFVTGSDRRQ